MVKTPLEVSPIVNTPVAADIDVLRPIIGGLGVVVLIVTMSALVGTTPPLQLVPVFQSLLVVPVQVCAADGLGAITAANSAEAETVVRKPANLRHG
jgi:hypothetical protein